MAYDPDRHNRRSMRLREYDYRQMGGYFVTICVKDHLCMFGEVESGEMWLNEYGRIVVEEWQRTAEKRPNVRLDAFVVMPNHVHGIIGIIDNNRPGRRDMACHVPEAHTVPKRQFSRPQADSLSSIVGAFKSAVTRRINRVRQSPGDAVWQPRFYDHVVRDRRDLARIRRYIAQNPVKWHLDRHHPTSPNNSTYPPT